MTTTTMTILLLLLLGAPSWAPGLQAHEPSLLGLDLRACTDGWTVVDPATGAVLAGPGRPADIRRARLLILEQRHGTGNWNLDWQTMGGRRYWSDVVHRRGWRIQRYGDGDHHRLLDPQGVRRAWGSRAACRVALERVELEAGSVSDAPRRAVVLIPGIARSAHALAAMGQGFAERGWVVVPITYASTQLDLEAQARDLAGLLADLPPEIEEIAFVTHSMGGLVVRSLHDPAMPPWRGERRVIGSCMLFPPNQGSALADALHETAAYRGFYGPAGEQLTSRGARSLPIPDHPVAILAGGTGHPEGRNPLVPGDDDGTVGVQETVLPGMAAHRVFPVGHTFGMNDPAVIEAAITWLETGAMPE